MLKKAILRTKGMFDDCNSEDADYGLWKSVEAYMDGEEALIADARAIESEYVFLGLTDASKNKELFYMMEQDGMTGAYIDDRASFDKDWDSGNYDRDCIMYLKPEWIERVTDQDED